MQSKSQIRSLKGRPSTPVRGSIRRNGHSKSQSEALLKKQLLASRDYAEDIIEAVPPLLVLDDKLRIHTVNQSFCKCFKITRRQAVNRLVYELGDGQWNIPALRTLLEEVLPKKNRFENFEVTHEFASIGRRTMLFSGRQVDSLQRILLSIRDITGRERSRVAMQTSEIRYRRLFETARDGILMLDPHARKITDANPFIAELLGYTKEELIGKELWEIGLLKDEKASRASFRILQQKHYVRYEDLPLESKQGVCHEVEFVSNLYDEGDHHAVQCNIRDITERKTGERALLAAKNEIARHALELELVVKERTSELEEKIAELERFSYSISHDMRAPVRAMQSFAQFLAEDYGTRLDKEGNNYVRQIMRSALRLDRLIQDVLRYSRIAHGKPPLHRVDLHHLVRDIIAEYSNGDSVKPEFKIKGKLPIVMGNDALLGQCISNLVANGVKFVSPGTTPRIEIFAETVLPNSIRVSFKDNGIGIAPENHERVFRLFERINPTEQFQGTGIGLSIVRKAAERMEAKIGFESELGKGSRFWIQIKKG
jgi:PAS domain S-box-containing protein